MANYKIIKTILLHGDKGDKGEQGVDTTVPIGAILAYRDEDIPEGYSVYKEVEEGGE